MLRAGRVVLPANGRGMFIPIFVDDLVDAIVRAAEAEASAGQVFNVTGGQAFETRAFFGYYSRMLGRGAPRVAPTSVAVALASAVSGASKLVGRPSDVSIDKARHLLGWEPAVDLDEGMRRTEAWLRASGYL
jgi:nucleoside-diphosphate-sugar epimerase